MSGERADKFVSGEGALARGGQRASDAALSTHEDQRAASLQVRGHRYGVRLMSTWPHVSLGLSAHFDRKYGHLSLHLPIGVLVLGFIGDDQCAAGPGELVKEARLILEN